MLVLAAVFAAGALTATLALCREDAAALILRWMTRTTTTAAGHTERYGTRHRVLNTTAPTTTWLNMGLWDGDDEKDEDKKHDENAFVRANERMAAAIARLGRWTSRETLLDVGYGCGDQDVYWWTHCRPKAIVGVTIEASQQAIAARKVNEMGLADDIRLHVGDATLLDKVLPVQSKVDVVVALDTAYHFNTRRAFVKQAYERLNPGGRIVMADIILGPNATRAGWWKVRLLSLMGGMPLDNLVQRDEYEARLGAQGFTDIEVCFFLSSKIFFFFF